MKKMLFTVMAIAAIGLTSCGNKTQQKSEAVDSAAIVQAAADEAAEGIVSELSANLEAGDANKLQQTLETVKEKVAELIKENPEVAKEYVAKVQEYLKSNADKIKSVVGDNAAVAAAVSAITEAEPASIVSGLLDQVDGAKDAVTSAAGDAKDAAVDAVNQKVEEGKAAAADKANEVKEAAKQKVEDAKEKAKEKAANAVDNAAAAAKSKLGI